jgi:hypothetical protein
VSGREVDPRLHLWNHISSLRCVLGGGKAPRLDDPGPVEKQPGSLSAQLRSSTELMTLGEVRGISL